jgi:hypothetical protein
LGLSKDIHYHEINPQRDCVVDILYLQANLSNQEEYYALKLKKIYITLLSDSVSVRIIMYNIPDNVYRNAVILSTYFIYLFNLIMVLTIQSHSRRVKTSKNNIRFLSSLLEFLLLMKGSTDTKILITTWVIRDSYKLLCLVDYAIS